MRLRLGEFLDGDGYGVYDFLMGTCPRSFDERWQPACSRKARRPGGLIKDTTAQ